MGLPEKIKNSLSPKKTRDESPTKIKGKPDNVPAKTRKGNSAPIARRQEAPGLPHFQPPPLPKDHRAILVACAKTRRASWAVIKDNSAKGSSHAHKWAFQRNITAVPATNAESSANSGISSVAGGSAGSRGSSSSQTKPAIDLDSIDLTGFSCGICRASRQTTGAAHLVSCGTCDTMMCVPQDAYKCPGCKTEINTSRLSEMHSLNASKGSRKPSRAPGAPGGSGRGSASSPRNPQVEGPGASGTSGGSRRAIGG
jgi:hypothetical protein